MQRTRQRLADILDRIDPAVVKRVRTLGLDLLEFFPSPKRLQAQRAATESIVEEVSVAPGDGRVRDLSSSGITQVLCPL